MCNTARQVPAPATCKAGGWSRQQRPFRPRRPVPLRPQPLPAEASFAGLSLNRSCAPLPAASSYVARLRATPPGIPCAATPRPPFLLVADAPRRRMIELILVKVLPSAPPRANVKFCPGQMLNSVAPRLMRWRSSVAHPSIIHLRSAWRDRGLFLPLSPNFYNYIIMSKSNMLLGLAKGKVGDLVFYRDGGEQRTRSRVTPKNPRTPAQMAQRVKIANVSGIYRSLASVLFSSFTNRKSNQSGYNVFAASAIPLAPSLTREMASAGVFIPQPCHLSKGVLPSLPFQLKDVQDGQGFGLSVGVEQTETTTCGQVSADIINRYPTVQQGDKIVAVRLSFIPIEDSPEGVDMYTPQVVVRSFVLDVNSTELIDATDFSVQQGIFALSSINESFNESIQLAGYIVTRVDASGSLQVSTEQATLSTIAQTLYEGYRTEQAVNDAVASYMAGTQSILR